mmetsp:Transcript_5424/g.13211  ORF Transcript_5424/g.13211 Transcript_5424/m.13211 type:complete len:206 (-) Transcript_5424:707-1324(-)
MGCRGGAAAGPRLGAGGQWRWLLTRRPREEGGAGAGGPGAALGTAEAPPAPERDGVAGDDERGAAKALCGDVLDERLQRRPHLPLLRGGPALDRDSWEGGPGAGGEQPLPELGQRLQAHVEHERGHRVAALGERPAQLLVGAAARVPRQEAHPVGDPAVRQGDAELRADPRRRRDAGHDLRLDAAGREVLLLLAASAKYEGVAAL